MLSDITEEDLEAGPSRRSSRVRITSMAMTMQPAKSLPAAS
ncbi:MAG: hypothetical protein U0894_00785 [Pirellulales bacterium]